MYEPRAEYLAGDLDDDSFYDWSSTHDLPNEDMIDDWNIHNDHAYGNDAQDYYDWNCEESNNLYDW